MPVTGENWPGENLRACGGNKWLGRKKTVHASTAVIYHWTIEGGTEINLLYWIAAEVAGIYMSKNGTKCAAIDVHPVLNHEKRIENEVAFEM
jgi:hypothetical protein